MIRKAEIYLKPGDWFVGDRHCRVRTVLGSCVSIVLWHPQLRVGAMSHCLLGFGDGVVADGRYVDGALNLMEARLRSAGAALPDCQAKVFGGGNMFPETNGAAGMDIGRSNGEAALELLRARQIEVVAESLYGVGHRVIVFDIASGNVWAQQIDPRELLPDAEGEG